MVAGELRPRGKRRYLRQADRLHAAEVGILQIDTNGVSIARKRNVHVGIVGVCLETWLRE